MNARPMLAYKLLHSTPQEWFGQALKDVWDADVWRYMACVTAAKRIFYGH